MTETTQAAGKPNYVQDVLGELAMRLPDCDTPLLELYALLALTTGTGTTLENVHDAWAVWRNRTRPDHPSLVPFIKLAPEVRELDRKYADAIRETASELVLGGLAEPPPMPLPPPVADYGMVRLELMGHRYREGRMSEVVIAGTPFLRLDLEGGASEFYRPDAVCCVSPASHAVPVPRAEIPARFTYVDEAEDTWGDEEDGGPF